MTTETWKPVLGFEGLYEVSNVGRVRRVGKAARNAQGRGGGAKIGHVLTNQLTPYGYFAIQLWRDGKMARHQVHRLVARAFHGEPQPGQEVNHKDGDKHNNADINLEWVTRSENLKHAYENGLRTASVPSGEDHHKTTLTDAQVEEIRRRYNRRTCPGTRLAEEFGVDHTTIYRIVKQQTRRVVAATGA